MLGEFWWFPSLLWCFWSLYLPSISNQRLFLIWFLKMFLSFHFLFFVFEISALGIFFLSTLLGCCLWVVAESEGCRVIFFLFISFNSKIQKKNCFLHSYALFAFCTSMVLALGFLGEFLVIFSYRNDCIYIWRKNFALHVVSYPIFHSTQCICIDC